MEIMRQSLGVLFHPIDAFERIKRERGKLSVVPGVILLIAVIAVRIASIFMEHFPMAAIQPRDANIWLEMVRMLLPLITWVVGCYAMTTILDGEVLLSETLLSTAYCMLPYIIFSLPLCLLSHLMQNGEMALYQGMHRIVWAWVFLLFFLSIKIMNGYTFAKTVGICILSLLTVILIWGICALFFAMTSQLYSFIADVALEIRLLSGN